MMHLSVAGLPFQMYAFKSMETERKKIPYNQVDECFKWLKRADEY